MQVGLFMTPQWAPGADLERGIQDLVEQARAARDAGFSALLIGQHVVTGPEMQMLQTMPLMARLIPETQGMQIGPGVLLLSMMSPVMVAEEGATIDWLSDGNFVLACGLGYRPEEFEAMGARKAERVSRLEEGLTVVKRLWAEERVTHHGKHFHLSNVGSSVRPKQQPHPPIWLGGDVEPAIRRAARLADAWLASPTMAISRLQKELNIYAEERQAHGLSAADCPLIRECFVGKDADDARRASRSSLIYKYQAYASWGHVDTVGHDIENRFEDFAHNRFLIGDKVKVREEFERYAEVNGVGQLVLRIQWPGLKQTDALANIERIGEVVADVS